MPLVLGGRIKDAVVAVRADSDWLGAVGRFLSTLTDDAGRVDRHLRLLQDRAAGRIPWQAVFADARLPDGRPMPPGRRYAEMLVTEDRLPLYEVDSLRFSLDLHNPANEAEALDFDPSLVEIAIVGDVGYFTSVVMNSVFDPELPLEAKLAARAANGATLGRLVEQLAAIGDAVFGYADVGETGWRVASAMRPESVVHPSREALRPWDFLWSITAWSASLLDGGLGDRIRRLAVTDDMLSRIDRAERAYFHIDRRALGDGGLFLQYRFLLGSEGRNERAAIDTPLARAARLRSTNLLFRT